MVIVGEWFLCDDGIVRPVVRVQVPGENSEPFNDRFLVDTAADRTALSAPLFRKLQLPVNDSSPGV
jgi:hypothetical protein